MIASSHWHKCRHGGLPWGPWRCWRPSPVRSSTTTTCLYVVGIRRRFAMAAPYGTRAPGWTLLEIPSTNGLVEAAAQQRAAGAHPRRARGQLISGRRSSPSSARHAPPRSCFVCSMMLLQMLICCHCHCRCRCRCRCPTAAAEVLSACASNAAIDICCSLFSAPPTLPSTTHQPLIRFALSNVSCCRPMSHLAGNSLARRIRPRLRPCALLTAAPLERGTLHVRPRGLP